MIPNAFQHFTIMISILLTHVLNRTILRVRNHTKKGAADTMKPVISEDFHRYCSLNNEISECYHNASTRLGLSDSIMQILYVISLKATAVLFGILSAIQGLANRRSTLHFELWNEMAICNWQQRMEKENSNIDRKWKRACRKHCKKMIRAEVAVFDAWAPEDRSAYLELTKRFLSDLEVQFHKL